MEGFRVMDGKGILAPGVVCVGDDGGGASPLEKYRKQGVALYKEQKYDESMAALWLVLHQDQFDSVSNAYQGLIHFQRGELEQAEYHYRVALNSDPSNEIAKEGLTETLIKKGKPDEAMDALERAAKMAEGVEDPRWEKSNMKKPYTKQVEERLYLGKVKDRMRIAKAYQSLGDYDNALVYYKKALEMSPENVMVLMAIAEMSEKAGNKGAGEGNIMRAYRKDPKRLD